MSYYIAAFLPVQEGGYAIFFPDFPEIASEGGTLEECMKMGSDALSVTVDEYIKARRPLPVPATHAGALCWAEKEMLEDGADVSRKPILQFFQAPSVDLTPIKISISLAKATLEEIDAKAKAHGFTRSGFLAHAAQEYRA